jgi:hypothetical protein
MLRKSSLSILLILGLLPVALNCECEGGDDGFTPDEAGAGKYHIGTTQDPPAVSSFADTAEGSTPGEAQIDVDFGMVDVASTSKRYLFIKNTGSIPLNLVGIEWRQMDAAFVIACFDDGAFVGGCEYSPANYLAIEPEDNLIIEITYAPPEVAQNDAAFLLRTNAADYRNILVNLTGQGVTPEIQVCISDCQGDQMSEACQTADEKCNDDVEPELLEVLFGDEVAGETVDRLVVVYNHGDKDLTVSGLQLKEGNPGQFRLQVTSGTLPGTISARGEAHIVTTYQPSLGGDHTTTLEIISDDVNERELRVLLSGRGLAPRVCPEPLILDFGNVAVGEPEEKFFTITNCGLLNLEIERVAMNTESSTDFSLTNQPTFPLTLAPEDSVDINVTYDPVDRGSDHGGVDIFSDDPSSDPATHKTGTVSVTGNGIIRECIMQPIPTVLNFGGVVQGETDSLTLTLANHGNDTCRFDSAEISENSADLEFSTLVTPTAGQEFEPGDPVWPEIEIQYAPTGLGIDNAKLKIVGNDRNGPEMFVDIVGEGVETAVCDLQVTPTSMNFGTVKLNNSQSNVFTLVNQGNADCHVDAPELFPSTLFPGDFSITRGPTTDFVLARRGRVGDREEIEITFAPNHLDMHKATFWLHTDDDPDLLIGQAFCFKPGVPPVPPDIGDACINILGMSAESDIEVVPSELDFGVVTVGCNSPELHVTVYNLGSYALNVTDIYLEDPADPNFEITQAPMCSQASPHVLNGGSSFEIRLRYHPQDINPHRSTLYIASDASNVELLAVPLFGRGTNISDQTDVFHQPTEVKSDVLFVVDNSGSMGEEQSALASNFSSFIQHTTTLDVDYHIGVIANEVQETETGIGDPPRDVFPGVLVQAPGCPKIITNNTPDVTGCFADNVKIGTCCSDEQEAGLEAAWIALSPPEVDDPALNGGFMREDAKLYIVCVSDEQDQSKGNPDFYVDFFSAIKGYRNTEWMKVSAICGDCPSGCGGEQAECGSRYIEVANRTGGIFESICTSNWAVALENLGIDAFAEIREFPLSRPADPSTITVTVNGVPVDEASSTGGANGWTYYSDTNSIYFGDDCVPGKGDTIEVSYTAACL